MRFVRLITMIVAAFLLTFNVQAQGDVQSKPSRTEFTLGISIYAGWMPWYHAKDLGIIKKWADKKGIKIEVVEMDYIPSVEAYVAEKLDACVMTNMEALDMPAASGIDTTVIVNGDYSNGNDALLVRDDLSWKGLKGKEIFLVQGSVSHYLLVRGLEMNGLKEKDITVVNTSDSDIAPAFLGNKSQKAVVTWNPMVMTIEQTPGIVRLFDSSKTPGEIMDLLVVNTKVLNDNPALAEALTGAWYEIMGIMTRRGPEADTALTAMAKRANCTLEEFKGQLRTTAMYWTPKDAIAATASPDLKTKMDSVRQFCFGHGLMGEGAKSVDIIGISYPDGTIQGDAKKVRFRFTTRFMELAEQGKL